MQNEVKTPFLLQNCEYYESHYSGDQNFARMSHASSQQCTGYGIAQERQKDKQDFRQIFYE